MTEEKETQEGSESSCPFDKSKAERDADTVSRAEVKEEVRLINPDDNSFDSRG